jgi:hypothetical protein
MLASQLPSYGPHHAGVTASYDPLADTAREHLTAHHHPASVVPPEESGPHPSPMALLVSAKQPIHPIPRGDGERRC